MAEPQPLPQIQSATHIPTPPLDRFVELLWYQHIPVYSAHEVILHSPYMELIVNFGQPHKVFAAPDLQEFQWRRDHWPASKASTSLSNPKPAT